MEWGPIITGVLSIAGLLLKWYMDRAPQRAEEARNEATQKGRQDIATGNIDAIDQRLDIVLSQPTAADCAPGQHSDADLLQRLERQTGCEVLPGAGSPGPVAGAGGAETNHQMT